MEPNDHYMLGRRGILKQALSARRAMGAAAP